ncbi:MAG: flagellar outer dynein arm light chain 5 [Monoraphidium minutum]|nr:MAG: flagellar outer dynein arm light chain 5 [Monoraphidium minutum]
MPKAVKLSDEEIVLCRKAFQGFDKDGSGTIDVKELKSALSSMGQDLSDEELFVLIHDVDEDNSGEIEFSEASFCKVILKHKAAASETEGAEAGVLDAFVALGGNEFELTLDVDRLIREVDLDRSGFLDFHEFSLILKG